MNGAMWEEMSTWSLLDKTFQNASGMWTGCGGGGSIAVTDVIGSEQEETRLDGRFGHLHQLPIDDPADHRWLAVSVDSSECPGLVHP
jgi:hypothetical protein